MPRGVKAVTVDGISKPRAAQKRVFHFIIDKEILASGSDATPVVAVYTDARKLVEFMFGPDFDKSKHAHFKYEAVARSNADAAEPELAV